MSHTILMKFIENMLIYIIKGETQCIDAPTQGGVSEGIIETYSYGCKVERHSNPGPLGTCEDDFICTRPAFT
jgi:hypothetical protein